MKTRTHLSRLIPALLVKAFIAAWITFAFFHPFDDDEFQHTHFSWLINKGQLPYKDFFEHHMPVYHLFLSPLFFLTGGSAGIFLFRLVSVVSGLGTLLCVYLLSKRYASRTASALMVIIMGLTPMFMFKIVEARPASPAMLALSMAMLLLFGKEKGKWSDLTAGILAGLCVLLSQKYVFVTAGLILALIIQKRWRACLLTFMGMIIPSLMFVMWLAAKGILPEFYEHVVIINLTWRHRFSPAGYLSEMWSTAGPLIVMAFLGVMLSFISKEETKKRHVGMLVVMFASALSCVLIIPEPYRQSFLPLFPVIAIAGAMFIDPLLKTAQTNKAGKIVIAVIILAMLGPSAGNIAKDLRETCLNDLNTMKIVDRLSSSGPIFDGRGLMFYRMHVGRHACMHDGIMAMLDEKEFANSVIKAMEKENYPTVIRDYRVERMPVELLNFIDEYYLRKEDTEIFLPGTILERLSGSDHIELPVDGTYRISWRGDSLSVNNMRPDNKGNMYLGKGEHELETDGYAEDVTFILIERK